MNKIKIFIIALFIGGCIHQFTPDEFQLYETEGLIAFVVNAADNPAPLPATPSTCPCNGTGKEKTGDGLAEVKCRCGDNCKCKAAKANKKRALLFTAPKSCSPCAQFEKKSVPVLKKNGWTIGPNATNLIQTIDTDDEANSKLVETFNIDAIPTFVLLEDDKEIDRVSGFKKPKEFTDFFLKERK